MTKLLTIAIVALTLTGCEASRDVFHDWGKRVLDKNEQTG